MFQKRCIFISLFAVELYSLRKGELEILEDVKIYCETNAITIPKKSFLCNWLVEQKNMGNICIVLGSGTILEERKYVFLCKFCNNDKRGSLHVCVKYIMS